MNKYLLLRDNKQSGPYTVPELIAKGIKAYDLVWLEGKSAAWRYPGEIDELKGHAPLVEEQPYDRFFKKPEADNAESAPVVHSRYQPAVSTETPVEAAPKRIYVNFPAKGGQSGRNQTPAKEISHVQVRPPVFRDRTIAEPVEELPPPGPAIAASGPVPETDTMSAYAVPRTRFSDTPGRSLYKMAAVLVFFVAALVIYLFVSFYQQRQSINELNAHIQQLEKRSETPRAQQTASLLPPPPENADVAPTDGEIADDKTPVVETAAQAPKAQKGIPARTVQPSATEQAPIVFKEHKHATTVQENVNSTSPAIAPAETENLFDLVNVKANKYKTGVLGGISNLQLQLNNSSAKNLQRVSVEIRYLGPEKRVVKTQTVQFDNVAAGTQVTLDVPKSNRGVAIEFAVIDIKS